MALRLNSLKTRTAFAIASVIVVILVVNAVYLILTKRSELKAEIEEGAARFATLTRAPICVGYETYYLSGFYKFRELMRDFLVLDENVERVLIVNVNGRILFDSKELDDTDPQRDAGGLERWVRDPERLEAIKKLEPTRIPSVDETGEERLEIVAPYIEDWGRHRLSVVYHVSFRKMGPAIRELVYATVGLTFLSILASVGVALWLASRITRPLEELTAGALDLAEGHFDRRLTIRSNDEIQILADAFNTMTERLKENVEQLEESNKKLGQVNEELKELDRLKSDLLANVSHELRTPLTAIRGYTDYMREGKLGPVSDKQEKGLLVVGRNLERLSRSINDLLDFSRMETGRIALNIAPFSLRGLVEQIATTVRSELDKKRLTLHPDVPDDLAVIADREKISQVIENLVINAIKFTPEGGRLEVAARRARVGERWCAEVRIEDTGIGIPPAQLDKVFNRFHQVDGSTTRRFGGVGLGLSIVKSILDAHGVAIDVESEEGRGTLFRFALPLREGDAEGDRSDRGAATGLPAAAARGRLLVVDDEAAFRDSLRAQLEAVGYVVRTAASVGEATAAIAASRPDAVLLDLMLPDGSGLELLRQLKADDATRDLPVLVISVSDDSPRALSLGAAECLMKPVDRGALTGVLRRLLAGGRSRPRVLVADDEPDTVQLLCETLQAEGFDTVAARDGAEALDVLRRERPDLLLLDVMMPRLSGFEVMESMRRNPDLAGIPVVVLTARGDEIDVRRGLALGARRYVSKPFDVQALIGEVRRHVTPAGRAS
ncbi:MAG: response regulator [Vicinamibacteria bacterium]|nr:response regulator [Vicinamibacteria bacterium]